MNIKYYGSAERILLTLWVGGMWTTGYIVAPTLFAMLKDNKPLAGNIAGQLFTVMSFIGLACAVLLLIAAFTRAQNWWRDGRVITLLVMMLIILVGQFVLQPMMAELKAAGIADGSSNAAQFGRLHGVASLLFLVNSLLGLGLVAFTGRSQPDS
jgi:hypothetical protein